jgi:hypothetical protein
MRSVTAHHIEVVMQLSALRVAVSLATQSIVGHLPIDVSKVGVVREMVARFWEWAEWCSRLKTYGSRVCDVILGPVNGWSHWNTRLEEATGRLQVMQDEH